MSANSVVLRGIVRADGTLDLSGTVGVPPGSVEVTLRPVPAPPGENLLGLLARIRAEQAAGTEVPRSAEEIDTGVRALRDEWNA